MTLSIRGELCLYRNAETFFLAGRMISSLGVFQGTIGAKHFDRLSRQGGDMELALRLNIVAALAAFVFLAAIVTGMI